MGNSDTIVAVATPPGVSFKGIIRLSGSLSFPIINQRFYPDQSHLTQLKTLPHYTSGKGYLQIENPKIKIPVWLYLMKAPRSYTREDVVEIHTMGSAPLLELVIEDLTRDTGIRLARPGEFTQRAFLTGRIDLAQAESVLEIIKSRNEQSLKSAINQLKGGFSQQIKAIQQELINLLANLEAALDFSDQDIEIISRTEVNNLVNKLQHQLRTILESGRKARVFKDGIRAVLCGQPNVGKSRLFNCLVSDSLAVRTKRVILQTVSPQDASAADYSWQYPSGTPHYKKTIVTSIPGTTRDVIEGILESRQSLVRIYDTAGLFDDTPEKTRSRHDEFDHKIQKQTREFLESAELYLMMVDASHKINQQDKALYRELDPKRTILVINKSDLKPKDSPQEIKQLIGNHTGPTVSTSALTGQGINLLKKSLFKMVQGIDRVAGDFYINTRHQLSLDSALRGLAQARSSLEQDKGYELIVLDLKEALEALGEIIGKTYSEDILNRVFSRFCIGK